MSRFRRIVALAAATLVVVAPVGPALADSVQSKQHEADQIAARIDSLQSKSEQLSEAYNQAVLDLGQIDQDVTAAEARLTRHEADLATLHSRMAAYALKSYVYADQASGVATLLDQATLSGEAAGRQGYVSIALGADADLTDAVGAARDDDARLRADLAAKQKRQRQLAETVSNRKTAAEKAIVTQQALLGQVKGELADLVAQVRQRQEQAAAQQAQAALAAAQATANQATANQPTANQPTLRAVTIGRRTGGGPAPARAPARSFPVPPPAAGAAGAVRAALSQVGNRYVAFQASPATGFDCSGLTMWAWAQAGVSLPHYSRAQYASLPHVPLGAIQPGDLVFFGNPIHHVGIYIGGGQMVHASMPGVGVVIGSIRNPVGVARP